MLGKLAKYLRFMGYDTYYPDGKMSDDEILKIARKEGRVIITRDKELARRSNGFLVKSINYEEQLREVIKRFNLNTDNILSRCSVCNEPLIPVAKEEVRGKVPDYVYQNNDEFYICPKCHRIYWYGTHTAKIEKKIKEIMGEEDED
jgi:uncharacterized protein with PIN domain